MIKSIKGSIKSKNFKFPEYVGADSVYQRL